MWIVPPDKSHAAHNKPYNVCCVPKCDRLSGNSMPDKVSVEMLTFWLSQLGQVGWV